MRYIKKVVTASAGTNTFSVKLSEGAKLRRVNISNYGTPWLPVQLMLSNKLDDVSDVLSLIKKTMQVGLRGMSWEGIITIEAPYAFVIATFFGCTLGDIIAISLGWEP